MSDATVVTRGSFRLRGTVEWTRIDGIYGLGGATVAPLGSSLTGELHSGNLPLLLDGQAAAREMAADPTLSLSAGQLTTSADSRIATVPLAVEYGLTSRITLGVVIPIVQSRTEVTTQLNGPADSIANVGTNPSRFHSSATAQAANATVFSGLTTARDQLAQRVAACAASPSSPGCAAVNARAAEASALLAATSGFTAALSSLYGISTDQPGAPFVPLSGSAAQAAIDARLADLRASYTSFGFNGGTGALAAAQAQAANSQFQRLVNDPEFGIELDSVGTTEQTAIGDIELSAAAMLFNSFGKERGVRLRGVAAGVVRLGTGHPARANRPYDVPTGDGQTDLEGRVAIDAMYGRLLTTLAGTYTLQTGSVETTRLPVPPGSFYSLDAPAAGSIKLGNMVSARLNPRFLVTPGLAVGAIGIASHRAADVVTGGPTLLFGDSNALTVFTGGFTISYSNLSSASGVGNRQFPAEFVFTHLETLVASDMGAEKSYRDAIELRVYLRTRR